MASIAVEAIPRPDHMKRGQAALNVDQNRHVVKEVGRPSVPFAKHRQLRGVCDALRKNEKWTRVIGFRLFGGDGFDPTRAAARRETLSLRIWRTRGDRGYRGIAQDLP